MPFAADRPAAPTDRGFSCDLVASVTPAEGRALAELGAALAHARAAGHRAALDPAPRSEAVDALLEQIQVELDRVRGRLRRGQQ